jgi:uncharacterized NAD(P)/FAD-binding protein YdhS
VTDPVDLAVVGGGPAGVATLLAAETLAPDWRVAGWRGTVPGFLPAYGGNDPVHRLNVAVERMGLDAAAPIDFYDWLQAVHPERRVRPGDFVPRAWFGEYLAHRAASVRAGVRPEAVVALDRCAGGWRLQGAGGDKLVARRVALCLGMPAGVPMPGASSPWVGDPWAWWRAHQGAPLPLAPSDRVLVVGSGLTAVDMVLGLRARGFAGPIEVVSTGGRWSTAHAPAPPLDPEARDRLDDALDAATGARGTMRVLRRFAAEHPWRAVVDALRADTNARWAALGLEEQRRVMRHAFGLWNRHRHRMAPDVLATLEADRALRLRPGRIAVEDGGRIVLRHAGRTEALDAALVLDCRGPGFRAALAGDSLLARLVRDGVLQAHPLGTGVQTPADPTLAVLGAARFGECFETTAVPELRQQAVAVVARWVEGA